MEKTSLVFSTHDVLYDHFNPSLFGLNCGNPYQARRKLSSGGESPRWSSREDSQNTSPIASMGLVYSPTWMVDLYGFHVGKYTSPMDASWIPAKSLFLLGKVRNDFFGVLHLADTKSRWDPPWMGWWEGGSLNRKISSSISVSKPFDYVIISTSIMLHRVS